MSPRRRARAAPTITSAPAVDVYARLSRNPDGKIEKIEDQIADCRAVAERRGLVVGEVHCDNSLSAWRRNVKRPGWEAMLARIEEGKTSGVVVWHLDRLFRQPHDLERLIDLADKGVTLASAHGSRDLADPDDRFILRIEVAHACRSSDDTSRRVRRRIAAVRERGAMTGGPRPFAFPGNAPRVPGADPVPVADAVVERERQALREAADAVLAGTSLGAIARSWNTEGLVTTGGGTWTANRVREVLVRQRNAGRVEHRGVVVGMMPEPPIIEPATHDRVQALMASRRRGRPPSPRYLATGIARCGAPTGEGDRVCGKPLAGRPKAGTYDNGQPRRDYFCAPQGGGCGRTLVDAGMVETEARTFTIVRLSDPRHAAQVAAVFAEAQSARAELDKEITEAEQTVARLKDRLRRKELSLRAYESSVVAVEEHLDGLVAQRDALEVPVIAGPVEAGRARDQLEAEWDAGTQEHRRSMLVSALGSTVRLVILPAGGNRRHGPDPARVAWLPVDH